MSAGTEHRKLAAIMFTDISRRSSCPFDKQRLGAQALPTPLRPPAKIAQHELLWVRIQKWIQPQRGCGKALDGGDSIPNISLVPFDLVPAQQGAQLVLKSKLAMLLLLSGDVLLHLFEIRLAHEEIRVAWPSGQGWWAPANTPKSPYNGA